MHEEGETAETEPGGVRVLPADRSQAGPPFCWRKSLGTDSPPLAKETFEGGSGVQPVAEGGGEEEESGMEEERVDKGRRGDIAAAADEVVWSNVSSTTATAGCDRPTSGSRSATATSMKMLKMNEICDYVRLRKY